MNRIAIKLGAYAATAIGTLLGFPALAQNSGKQPHVIYVPPAPPRPVPMPPPPI